MIFFKLSEIVLGIVVFVFFATQIIAPAVMNTRFFPFFRKQGKLEKEVTQLNQRDVEEKLEVEIAQRQHHNEDKGTPQ